VEERQDKAIWIETGWCWQWMWFLEGGVIFFSLPWDRNLNFEGQKLVQATESGNINGVEECELLISGVGQRSQFGESTRRIKCGLWQRTTTGIGESQAGQTDKQWTNELLATRNG